MTRRSVLLGLLFSLLAATWPAWSEYIIRSSRADYGHLSAAILIPFIILIAINSRFAGARGLNASELIVIVSMGMIASLAQGEWVAGYFLGTITSPTYFATVENGWEEALLSNVPHWSIIADRKVATAFYEGLPLGADFPWAVWWPPLMWWGLFLVLFFIANLSVVVIFRRQWMDYERLPFPIAVGLLEMTGQGSERGTLTLLARNRLYWIGFGILFAIFAWDQVAWFSELMPELEPQRDRIINLMRGFPFLRFSPNPMAMTFAWFVKSEVLFSIWAFHLLMVLQVGIMNRLGYEMGSPEPLTSFHPAIGWQSFGGLVVFVVWGLWVARHHLAAVLRQAFLNRREIDDSEELMSYRTAVFLLIGCGLFSVTFLWRCGVALGALAVFGVTTMILYLGFARIIVETGLVFLRVPVSGQATAWHLFGIQGIDPASAVALSLAYTFFADGKTLFTTTLAHIPRLGMSLDKRARRRLPTAVTVALVAGLTAVCAFTILHGNYGMGTRNFNSPSYNGGNAGAIWGVTATRIRAGSLVPDMKRVLWLIVGIIFTTGLYGIRYRFPRFALHPIGFAISGSDVLRTGVSSVFFIWLAKDLVFRFGGLDRYRRTTPFVMGGFMGYLTAVATGIIVDAIWFPGKGHLLHGW